ncbi:hypothetical protein AB1Y20_006392 [Prymnesium parvum]|uniref:Uncharacterized protein n=1 Tax=Prymnesium parvum TaxID=97485 RepID=A0AB34J4N3_PRYPA
MSEFLHTLPPSQKFALGGLAATLLGRRAPDWTSAFTSRFLHQLLVDILRLSADQFEALAPLTHANSSAADPAGFVALLPAASRRRLVGALVASLATAVGCSRDASLLGYDARARQLLCDVAAALDVPAAELAAEERAVAIEMKTIQQHLLGAAGGGVSDGHAAAWRRGVAIASVSVVSGAVIGVTGGLAAPAVIGGIAALGGGISSLGGAAAFLGASVTGVASLLSGVGGIAIVTTIFGAAGAELGAKKMHTRLKDVSEFHFSQPDPAALREEVLALTGNQVNPALVVSVCVSGWLANPPDWHDRHWFGKAAAKEKVQPPPETFFSRTTEAIKRWSPFNAAWGAWGAAPPASQTDATPPTASTPPAAAEDGLEERVKLLVESGFRETDVRRVVARWRQEGVDPSVEQITDELIANRVEVRPDEEMTRAFTSSPHHKPPRPSAASSSSGWSAEHITPWVSWPLKSEEEQDGCGVLDCLPHIEHHVLEWESKELRDVGEGLSNFAAAEAVGYLKGQIIKQTFFSALASSYALPALLMKVHDIIDHPWAVAYGRSQSAAKLLADILISRAHGARPVVLLGFGLGANLLFECLQLMARQLAEGNEAAAGVVQHVVLMGTPCSAEPTLWRQMKRVVAGRIINCYRSNDLVLSLIHRASNLEYHVAGLGPVDSASVENVDVSNIVPAHHKYKFHIKEVLKLVQLEGTEREGSLSLEKDTQKVVDSMMDAVEALNESSRVE